MRSYGVNRSSLSRYMGRSGGVRRSSYSVRSRYKLNGTKFQSYLEEAKRLVEENKEAEKTAKADESAKTYSSNTGTRTKASSYKTSGSKFNTGVTAMENGVSDMAKLLKNEDGLDRDKAFDAAEKYVRGYNEMFDSAKSSNVSTVRNRAAYIKGLTGTFTRALKKAGINVDTDGRLSVDKEAFTAADRRDIEAIFGKRSSYSDLISEQVGRISDMSDAKDLLNSLSSSSYSSSSTYSASSLFGRSAYSRSSRSSASIDWFDKLY